MKTITIGETFEFDFQKNSSKIRCGVMETTKSLIILIQNPIMSIPMVNSIL